MRLNFLVKNLGFQGFSAVVPSARSLHKMNTGTLGLGSTDGTPVSSTQ